MSTADASRLRTRARAAPPLAGPATHQEPRGPRLPPTLPSFWQRRHLLDLDDFSPEEITLVLDTADAMKEVLAREIARVPTLRGTNVVTLFYEASTRTRTSFELAAKVLGADCINIAAGVSSVQKGESLIDTVRTLQAVGAHILVMRHHASGAPYLATRHCDLSVINAGDGWHAHPTQALLDLFTVRSHLGDVRGRRVVIVGDIAHSRVARSNMWGFTALGAQVVLCGPPTLIPVGLNGSGDGEWDELSLPPVHVETDLDCAIEGADVVMALRLQLERMQTSASPRPEARAEGSVEPAGLIPSLREYALLYQVNGERLARARPGALVLHPGPMNEGVEISPEVAHGAQSLIEEQVANGVAVRMAVLYLLARSSG